MAREESPAGQGGCLSLIPPCAGVFAAWVPGVPCGGAPEPNRSQNRVRRSQDPGALWRGCRQTPRFASKSRREWRMGEGPARCVLPGLWGSPQTKSVQNPSRVMLWRFLLEEGLTDVIVCGCRGEFHRPFSRRIDVADGSFSCGADVVPDLGLTHSFEILLQGQGAACGIRNP